MNINTQTFLKPKDVQRILKISYPTVIRWAQAGKIPSIKIGEQLRFPITYFEEVYQKSFENLSNELQPCH